MTPAQELADDLIGTCQSKNPEEILETEAACAEFDSLAFECEQCGWWCSTDELNNENGERKCDECHDDDAPDEDDEDDD